ncbi:hypothetical protein SPRG_11464 [Saprolegnia parasitica CBS 223.65]|uniref:Uncharacterized protein n=1 Tax=Saprolegnia parasitica (strain CBS 223.65) TaxID=695850 RepID=A0A067C975_SAPPC|nr:hypothetical protein SPRG_11464 [Saprolegnia parasitica CBS 223.65]KDO23372.1 hypothetical protein SPRG_11464 [Saprolegnia parasitica CBS 223.65]|eukprot:XP_012205862.1 hypothetical protein SPRG_11464 [Saprolegnia parasitica CBS 223.65]
MDHRSDIVQQAEVGVNLPLQMLLYYNVYFDAFTYPIWIAVFYHKMTVLSYVSTIRKYAEICCVCIYVPTDVLRLYLGYSGNLLEKVPHLVGFAFLTVVPQMPCMLAVLHLVFLCAQMYHAYYACRASIRRQTAHFMRLCDNETTKKKVV